MRWPWTLVPTTLAVCATVLLGACAQRLEPPLQRGELLVAVRKSPASYSEQDGVARGFDHDLAKMFAQELGINVRFVIARNQAELLRLVKRGRVHLALGVPLDDDPELRYSEVLREADHVLVQNADAPEVNDVAALAGKTIEVLNGAPELAELKKLQQRAATFAIVTRNDLDEMQLLERVSNNKSDLAATDSTHFNIVANYYPQLVLAQELPGKVRWAWVFDRHADTQLYDRVQDFIRRIRTKGLLARMHDRYFGYVHRITANGVADFLDRLALVLPHYRGEFIAAQELTGVDWRLLAALAYQESHWDPLATSPTGVRGMMMLTEDTADRMNVKNRLDPRQSIRAGAKYLAETMETLSTKVKEPDRTWLALAAYNLGLGHMNGARAIAASLKRDPDSWYEMKQVLPLMAKKKYYTRLKSGAARGGEAVIMVENVRSYYDILTRFEAPHQQKNYAPPIFSIPPMYGTSTLGTETLMLPH